MDTFNIKPGVDGARLRDPVTGDLLASAGETKPRNAFWLRLKNRGDVVEVQDTSAASSAAAAPDTSSSSTSGTASTASTAAAGTTTAGTTASTGTTTATTAAASK
ncbi:Protein of unknown function [Faunimonas pinastri]|uniref:DUF2635 domain-containing protein n=1 Tax=Faunimonas pinastri TaxID=1855383 RepID=A0A1H9GF02_9HYPH|nr:DUF2635 domain-containing protein [Faunimonas pinastri]SEQ48647.1 Protein of unknown function [Faunimonas pinastri]